MKKPLILIPIEVKTRGLDPRLYLALKFIKNEYDVIIGGKNNLHYYLESINRNFIYFSKGEMPENDKIYSNIGNMGGLLVYLDEEGGIYRKSWDSFLWRCDNKIMKHVELYFAWGAEIKKVILENKEFDSKKIFITGNPRFDLVKQKFNSFHLEINKRKLEGKYILINTAFGLANEFITKEFDFDKMMHYRKERFGDYYNHIDFLRTYYYQKLLINYFIEAIKSILKKFPNQIVVLRPHPNENIEYYKSLISHKNLIISNEGSVQEWIIGASLIIHHDCTTSIESLINQKPFISYCPILAEDIACHVPISISEKITNENDLLNKIDEILKKDSKEKIDEWKIQKLKPYIDNLNYDSAETIASIINEKYIKKEFNFKKKNEKYTKKEFNFKKKNEKISLKEKIKNKLIYEKNKLFKKTEKQIKEDIFSRRAKIKFPGLTKKEINERIHLFQKVDDKIPSVNTEKISENLFKIKKT